MDTDMVWFVGLDLGAEIVLGDNGHIAGVAWANPVTATLVVNTAAGVTRMQVALTNEERRSLAKFGRHVFERVRDDLARQPEPAEDDADEALMSALETVGLRPESR